MLANNDATVSLVATAKGRAWARTLRDQVIELMAEADQAPIVLRGWDPTLTQYSDDAITEEIRRRGL